MMLLQDSDPATQRFNAMNRAPHALHECRTAEEFCQCFQASTGRSVVEVTDEVVGSTTARAIFLVGSLPLGMATPGSDIDLIVLVDDRTPVQLCGQGTNTDQRLAFSNESDPLRVGEFLSIVNGILVDVMVVVAPAIKGIYARLRSKGPELGEHEILTLGRLSTGWLLWQSAEYVERNALRLKDSALDVYCCTRHFVSALHSLQKGRKAVDVRDIALALHLGRASVEAAYLAYFASEGFSYLGAKWLAQVGHARGAAERVKEYPLLQEGIRTLFPDYTSDLGEATKYLATVAEFLTALRVLIERKTLFRIAFNACPQIHSL